jgi:hypothetical protein
MAGGVTEPRRLTITFMSQGVEYAITYAHTDEPPEPALSSGTRGEGSC